MSKRKFPDKREVLTDRRRRYDQQFQAAVTAAPLQQPQTGVLHATSGKINTAIQSLVLWRKLCHVNR